VHIDMTRGRKYKQTKSGNKYPISIIKEYVEEQKSANYNNKSASSAKHGHKYFLNTNKRRRELFRQQNLHTNSSHFIQNNNYCSTSRALLFPVYNPSGSNSRSISLSESEKNKMQNNPLKNVSNIYF